MIVRAMKLLPVMAATVVSLSVIPVAPALADPVGAANRLTRPERSAAQGWQQVGEASYYSSKYNGRRTANGGRYNPEALTAAHPFLPLGTRLRVQAEDTGRSVVVVVTDRQMPNGRVLDLSRRAAEELDIIRPGRARVRLIALSEGEADTPIITARPLPRRHSAMGSAMSRHLHARRAAAHPLHAATADARSHRLAHRHAHSAPVT